jgi:hypothetical protein
MTCGRPHQSRDDLGSRYIRKIAAGRVWGRLFEIGHTERDGNDAVAAAPGEGAEIPFLATARLIVSRYPAVNRNLLQLIPPEVQRFP